MLKPVEGEGLFRTRVEKDVRLENYPFSDMSEEERWRPQQTGVARAQIKQ